jgi:hypothetical protein
MFHQLISRLKAQLAAMSAKLWKNPDCEFVPDFGELQTDESAFDADLNLASSSEKSFLKTNSEFFQEFKKNKIVISQPFGKPLHFYGGRWHEKPHSSEETFNEYLQAITFWHEGGSKPEDRPHLTGCVQMGTFRIGYGEKPNPADDIPVPGQGRTYGDFFRGDSAVDIKSRLDVI